jgi:hypothetical protein
LLARAGRATSVGSNSGAHSAILRGGDTPSCRIIAAIGFRVFPLGGFCYIIPEVGLQHYSAALVIGCKPSSSSGGS